MDDERPEKSARGFIGCVPDYWMIFRAYPRYRASERLAYLRVREILR